VTPVTIAEFYTMPDDKNTYYMVTGRISSLLGSNGKENDYGNLYITDGTTELYVYGTYSGWNAQGDARKFFIADNGIEVGDEITIIGYKDTYKELVELCQGVCFSFKKAGE
jgi:RPA family protein